MLNTLGPSRFFFRMLNVRVLEDTNHPGKLSPDAGVVGVFGVGAKLATVGANKQSNVEQTRE